MDKTNVMLLNEDRSLILEISFLGYKIEDVEAYLTKHFIECKKEYAKRWTQMKYV